MKNIFCLNKLFLVAIILFSFVACKKEDNATIADLKYSGPKMVSFNNYDGYQLASIPVKDSFIAIQYEVKLANTTSTANGPVTVKLVKDNNPIFEYNTINGTNLTPVPVGAYQFEQTEVTIPKGSRTTKVSFNINPTKLAGGNAFGLSIFSVSGDGAVVNADNAQTRLVVEIVALNQWDGVYRLKGSILRAGDPVKTGAVASYEMPLVTTGANSVQFYNPQLWADGTGVAINYPVLTISANNAVTITSNPPITPPVTNNPGYMSRYVSATKTFYVSFYWNGDPTSRLCTDTLTYLRPR